jgi:signal transduction histidine kinase
MNHPSPLQDWPCPTLYLDARGLVITASDSLCRLLDQDHAAIANRPFDSLLTPASRVLFQSYLHPLLQLHGNVEEISLALRTRQGAAVDVLFYSARAPRPAISPDTTDIAAASAHEVQVILAPIRRRRGIEDEMLRIKRAADLAPGLIFQLMQLEDGKRHFPFVSEAVRRLYGTTPEAAQTSADAVFSRVLDDDRNALLAALNAAADRGQDWTCSFRVLVDGAEVRWHELHCTPRELAGGVRLWHGHIADVTDRRAMEASLAEREAADRMAQVRSEFLARISHELRTPLNGIIGFTQLLASDAAGNLNVGQRQRLDVVAASGQHLLQLVDQVLDITSLESLQTRIDVGPVVLARCVHEALALVRNQAAAAGITLESTPLADDLTVIANGLRLRQVLVNLLSNAIKYNKRGGGAQLQVQSDAASVRLAVSDQGIGMTPQQQAELFQPFNRLGAQHTSIEGTGLGLVITRHLLTQMGSSLSVFSEAGLGSTFSFELPLHIGAGGPPAPAPNAAQEVQMLQLAQSAGTSMAPMSEAVPILGQVLYVEDNPVNAALMEAIIGMSPGVELSIVETGKAALELLDNWKPDLLLLDMHLPDMLGTELLVEIRRRFPQLSTPAVAVSAAARRDDIARALAGGFAAYWTKPLDIDRTLDELGRWLST